MRVKVIVLPLLLFATSVIAHAEPLKVKPGLWETTTATEKKGSKHPDNLDKLTPEQRTKVERELSARARTETHTIRSCLREDQIKSGEAFAGNAHHAACSHTFQTQTPSDVVSSIECRGANKMTGHVEMHAVDTEHMTGKVDMTYGPSDKLQLLTHSAITAHWVSADCGSAAAKANVHPH